VRRIIPCDTNPKILRFLRFLRVVLLVAAMLLRYPLCGNQLFFVNSMMPNAPSTHAI
jgi:hypothetical protein